MPSWERLDAASKSTGFFRNNTVDDFFLPFVCFVIRLHRPKDFCRTIHNRSRGVDR